MIKPISKIFNYKDDRKILFNDEIISFRDKTMIKPISNTPISDYRDARKIPFKNEIISLQLTIKKYTQVLNISKDEKVLIYFIHRKNKKKPKTDGELIKIFLTYYQIYNNWILEQINKFNCQIECEKRQYRKRKFDSESHFKLCNGYKFKPIRHKKPLKQSIPRIRYRTNRIKLDLPIGWNLNGKKKKKRRMSRLIRTSMHRFFLDRKKIPDLRKVPKRLFVPFLFSKEYCKCKKIRRPVTRIKLSKKENAWYLKKNSNYKMKVFYCRYNGILSSSAKLLLSSFKNKYLYHALDDFLFLKNYSSNEKKFIFNLLTSLVMSLHNNFSINFLNIFIDSIFLECSLKTEITHITINLRY